MATRSAEKKNETYWFLKSEGLLIAVLTLSGYLAAFIYETGFAKAFDIPFNLIDITFTTIVLSVVPTAVLAFLVSMLLYLIWQLFPDSDSDFVNSLKFAYFVLIPITFIYLPKNLLAAKVNTAFFFGVLFIVFIPVVTAILKTNAPDKKPKKRKVQARKSTTKSINKNENETIRLYAMAGSLICLIVYSFIYSYGIFSATSKANFQILTDLPHQVVLKIYGDKVITAEFDSNRK